MQIPANFFLFLWLFSLLAFGMYLAYTRKVRKIQPETTQQEQATSLKDVVETFQEMASGQIQMQKTVLEAQEMAAEALAIAQDTRDYVGKVSKGINGRVQRAMDKRYGKPPRKAKAQEPGTLPDTVLDALATRYGGVAPGQHGPGNGARLPIAGTRPE